MKKYILAALFAIATSAVSHADLLLTGTVVDKSTGETLPGAIVKIDGTHRGEVTDADGRFV